MIRRGLTGDIGTTGVESVGERLRRLRLERGLSQRELSAPGVSYAYISRIEAGARRPSVKALRMLARKLGVSAEYLETGSEIGDAERRELRLADAELRLRLDTGDVGANELEALLRESLAAGDPICTTRSRIALGLLAARNGDNQKTIAHLEEVAESHAVAASARPDVFATLGRAYAAAGEPRKAVELFERGLEETTTESPDDYVAQVRYATYLSFALTDLGNLDRAREVVQDALARGDEATDAYTRVRLYWSLGRIAHEQSRPLVALDNFRRALALLEAMEDTLHLARAHLSIAQSSTTVSEYEDAASHLERAQALLGNRPEAIDLAMLRRMQAELAVARGDGDGALRFGGAAVDAARELPNERGLALATLAAAQALAGDASADQTFREAVDLLTEHGTPRERSDVLRSYARYLRASGRETDALDVLERATEAVAGR